MSQWVALQPIQRRAESLPRNFIEKVDDERRIEKISLHLRDIRKRGSPIRWAASANTSPAVMKGSSRINCRTNVAFFMPAFRERRASKRSSSSVKRTVRIAMTE